MCNAGRVRPYRYTNEDPEPQGVTRVGTDGWRHFGQFHDGTKRWDWGDRWRRVSCRGTGKQRGVVMSSSVPYRREVREHYRWGWGPLSGRRKRAMRLHFRPGRLCHMIDGQMSHYHWYNDDKVRNWESLRGATLRFNLDAYRRLHTEYRRRTRHRNRRNAR